MDDDSNKRLDMGEFKEGITNYGLVLENEVSTFNSIKNGCLKYRRFKLFSSFYRRSLTGIASSIQNDWQR